MKYYHKDYKAKLVIDMALRHNWVVQYYNGETSEVFASPKVEEHNILLSRYAELVGRAQTVISDYNEVISSFSAAKLLVLSENVDDILEAARIELPINSFHIIKGSPNPFFVEFLEVGISKGDGLKTLCSHIGKELSL
jgi:hydroxymethylpyrimidine pyrophosphatase-like HAD family hydrolase